MARSPNPLIPAPDWNDRREYKLRSKIRVGAEDECWPWLGATIASSVRCDGSELRRAHLNWVPRLGVGITQRHHYDVARLVFWRATGVWPGDECVYHTCGDALCCNPKHLVGTAPEDVAAKLSADGRQSRGDDRYNSVRIDIDDVRIIRMMRDEGMSLNAIAREMGLSTIRVQHIVHGKTWAWLDAEAAGEKGEPA